MTKFPLFIKTAQNIKHPPIPPIMPLATYEEAVGYERIKGGYKQALRGRRKYTREAVKYDLFREKNNVDLWRELKSSKYTPGPYHFTVITEPKRRDLSNPRSVLSRPRRSGTRWCSSSSTRNYKTCSGPCSSTARLLVSTGEARSVPLSRCSTT